MGLYYCISIPTVRGENPIGRLWLKLRGGNLVTLILLHLHGFNYHLSWVKEPIAHPSYNY